MKRTLSLSISLVLLLTACGGASDDGGGEADTTSTAGDETPRQPITVETGSIEAALAGAQRTDEERARDAFRHPAETLEFFGLEPSMTVVEMGPGGGWYTAVLAPVLRDHGTLIVATSDPEESQYARRLYDRLDAAPEVFDQVERRLFTFPEHPSLGEPGSADMVVTFRSTHGWINGGHAQDIYQAMFDVLRPGGVLGVVQHRADEGADAAETSRQGYVPEAYVVELATNAGFVLEESSELNANADDDHDHPEGVWTLPPSLRLGDTDRAQWEAIGESDRMTLRFRKPAEDAAEDAAEAE